MSKVTVQSGGEIALPPDVCKRYGFHQGTSVRMIETGPGILLVPLTEKEMSPELAAELADWQALGQRSWERFPYESECE